MSDEMDALEEILERCDPKADQPRRRSPNYRRPHLIAAMSQRSRIKRAQSTYFAVKAKREGK